MTAPYLRDPDVTLYQGDCLEVLRELPGASANCCITSPPYWGLRDYDDPDQFGLEPTPAEYVARMVEVFGEVRRVLSDEGTLWLNLGDTFRNKELVGIPWRVAFALKDSGWKLRMDNIWHKPNPMPESVSDRQTKSHEYVFLFSKGESYFYDQDSVREPHESTRWGGRYHKDNPTEKYRNVENAKMIAGASKLRSDRATWDHYPDGGKNLRSVWKIPVHNYPGAHFATFPEELVRRCLLAGCPEGGTVLDPFAGSGTTGLVARNHLRHATLIELNETYCKLAAERLQQLSLLSH